MADTTTEQASLMSPPIESPTLAAPAVASLLEGCLLEVDMPSGRVFDPAGRLPKLLGLETREPWTARGLLRWLQSPSVVFGVLKAARLSQELTQAVVVRFGPRGQRDRHARLRLQMISPTRCLLHLMEFTEQRQQDIAQAVMETALQQGSNELYVLDEQFQLVNINRAALKNIGHTAEEVLNKPASITAPTLADPAYVTAQQDRFLRKRSVNDSYLHRRKDGSEYQFEFTSTQVRAFGQHWYVIIGQDKTETLRQQVALRESEERLATAVRSGQIAVVDFHSNNKVIHTSNSLNEWLQVDPPEHDQPTSQRWWLERIHQADKSSVYAAIDSAAEQNSPVDVKMRLLHSDGHYVPVRFQALVQTYSDGSIRRVSGTLSNETEQQRIERARDRLTRYLQALLASVNEAILSVDEAGRILEWNDAAKRLLPAALKARASVQGLFATPLKLAASTKQQRQLRELAQDNGEEPRVVEVNVSPLELDATQGYSLVLHDVTARVHQEAALRQAAADADAMARSKNEFLATMSHEIRTPMNGVLGMAQILLDSPLNEQQRDALDIMVSSGTALLAIINDVLDFSRLEAGKIELVAAPFNVSQLIEEVCALLDPLAREKQLTLTQFGTDTPVDRVGDAQRLRQILMNLVGNAIKFTEIGSVSVHLSTDATSITLAVEDSGIGIADAAIPELFDAFAQADASHSRRHGGSGLGLAICDKLVKAMDGQLTVKSTLGAGSCFTLTLPLPSAPESTGAADSHPTDDHLETQLIGREILVVEDNLVNQKVAGKLLEKLGCSVTLAANGVEALDQWQVGHFDLIFMDCQMPEMDGFEATRRIRAAERQSKQPAVPIVALTANVLEADRQACLAAGMNDHQPKPIVREALTKTLNRWLEEPINLDTSA